MEGNKEIATPMADQAESENRKLRARIFDLEYNALNTRDGLRVVLRALDGLSQTDAVNNMSEEDSALIFGTMSILRQMVNACDAAFQET